MPEDALRTHVYTWTDVCMDVCTYVRMQWCVYACLHVCTSASLCVCLPTCLSVGLRLSLPTDVLVRRYVIYLCISARAHMHFLCPVRVVVSSHRECFP